MTEQETNNRIINVARAKALRFALKATGQNNLRVINLGTTLKVEKKK